MYFAVLPSTGPTTMTTLTWAAATVVVGAAANPPNANESMRIASAANRIDR
jgi:LPXTG-motif cell wall-anchored protein